MKLMRDKIQIALASLFLLLIPVAVIAQGTGGKKKKKERTEPVVPAKKPAKKPVKTNPVKTKPAKQESSRQDPAPKPTTGTECDHEWVDLGLPSGVKWATCNVGAASPEEYGDYFAWGEKDPNSGSCSTDYRDMFDISGNSTYDVARANWGGLWRMPTMKEFEELKGKCKWTWTTAKGKNGYKVIGPNGNSIFFPAAGFYDKTTLNLTGTYGGYWSSTPNEDNTSASYYLYFRDGYQYVGWEDRKTGQSVRPVGFIEPKD